MKIEEVDVFDDDALRTWLDAVNTVDRFERGDASTPWTFPELVVGAREPSKSWKTIRLNGSVDGVVVAVGQVQMPLLDNLSAAEVEVDVLPGTSAPRVRHRAAGEVRGDRQERTTAPGSTHDRLAVRRPARRRGHLGCRVRQGARLRVRAR